MADPRASTDSATGAGTGAAAAAMTGTGTGTVPVVDGVFRVLEGGGAVLIGGRCTSCGRPDFPRAQVCAYCRSTNVEEAELGADGGTVWAWTSIAVAPPGYEGPVPYGFGVVELDEGIRVVTRLTEADPAHLSLGDRMRCVVDRVGADGQGNDVAAWAFEPVGNS